MRPTLKKKTAPLATRTPPAAPPGPAGASVPVVRIKQEKPDAVSEAAAAAQPVTEPDQALVWQLMRMSLLLTS